MDIHDTKNLEYLANVNLDYLQWDLLITLQCSHEEIYRRLIYGNSCRTRADDTMAILQKRLSQWDDGTYTEVEDIFSARKPSGGRYRERRQCNSGNSQKLASRNEKNI